MTTPVSHPVEAGVHFPADETGARSSTAFGRRVVAAALRPVDAVGADAARRQPAWRSAYVEHFRRLVEAGAGSPQDWLAIAGSGLDAIHESLVVLDDDGSEQPLPSLIKTPAGRELTTRTVHGAGEALEELVVPYGGDMLRGDELRRRLDAWVADGVAEPSAADAVREVMRHPEWLRLEGRTVAVLGAGAQMGPLTPLLRWGATVAAVDVPSSEIWERLVTTAHESAGRLLLPVGSEGMAGADLLVDVPAVADWLGAVDGRLVIGNYTYADGSAHVRLSAAVDVLTQRVREHRDDVALAFLATPTDAFVVPREAVEASTANYAARSRVGKLVGRPLRTASRGRLLHRAYLPGTQLGICDALVPIQGPNYALAKRLQRWRAAVARAEGTAVSLNVAPSTRTLSVLKNRALAAAYAGAHRFGVEIFTPATANTLMAALLVHDLNTTAATREHPWQDEAASAVHGGLWRTAYAPRSALGIAAVLGYGVARG